MPQLFNGSIPSVLESETWSALQQRELLRRHLLWLARHAVDAGRHGMRATEAASAKLRVARAQWRALPPAYAQLGSLSQSSGGLRAWLLTSAGIGGAPGL